MAKSMLSSMWWRICRGLFHLSELACTETRVGLSNLSVEQDGVNRFGLRQMHATDASFSGRSFLTVSHRFAGGKADDGVPYVYRAVNRRFDGLLREAFCWGRLLRLINKGLPTSR